LTRISDIDAFQVLDGRGDPTLAVTVTLESGERDTALVPAGKSKGKDEALELRDGIATEFGGNGVKGAARTVRDVIAPRLSGMDPSRQEEIDQALIDLDGTPNFGHLGSNAVLGASVACARAAAREAQIPLFQQIQPEGPYTLPLPQVSIIGGGLHADNPLEVQDFLVVPISVDSFSEAVQITWEVRAAAGELVRSLGHPALVGDGGGFAPPLRRNRLALDLVLQAIENAGYRPGEDLAIAMDVAANHLRSDDGYVLDGQWGSGEAFDRVLHSWVGEYPVVSLEDPFDEDDIAAWQSFLSSVGKSVQLVGDDLFVTHAEKLASGVQGGWANAILVKPNQVGTLTQTVAVARQAQEAGFGTVVSIRSGETEDAFIADLAVALDAGQIKLGSLARASRTAKFNRLLEIEHEFGTDVPYAGVEALKKVIPESSIV
jgi:enolase